MNGKLRLATEPGTTPTALTAPADMPSKAKTIWQHYTRISSKNGTMKKTGISSQVTASQQATKRSGGFAARDMSGKQWSITEQAAAQAVLTALETS